MKVGTLVTGAGNDTLLVLPKTPAFLLVGTTDTDLPLTDINIQIAGQPVQALNGQVEIQAISKYLMESMVGADVKIGQLWKIADGHIDKTCNIRLTNVGAATPDLLAYSPGRGSSAVNITQETLQANSSIVFSGFTALILNPANLSKANVIFVDGHTEEMTQVELNSLFLQDNQADANGQLIGRTVIDNKDGSIAAVELFTTGGGTMLVNQITM